MIIVKHNGGYSTYYGHLSRINTKIRKGSRIDQGQVIGYVGQTGLATGPHLHYEMRINNRAVNPLSVKIPHGKAVPKELMAEFIRSRDSMNVKLASISTTTIVSEKVQQKPADKKDG
ncbi:MAG: hypothetical protein A2X59_03040 [Nitrospirae bacterium GWC2_42_7]|nr:MAG: hypothetical protein A2X59_03040 [Nitrospirae bacterium GWC2_42_7]